MKSSVWDEDAISSYNIPVLGGARARSRPARDTSAARLGRRGARVGQNLGRGPLASVGLGLGSRPATPAAEHAMSDWVVSVDKSEMRKDLSALHQQLRDGRA